MLTQISTPSQTGAASSAPASRAERPTLKQVCVKLRSTAAFVTAFRRSYPNRGDRRGWQSYAADDVSGLPWLFTTVADVVAPGMTASRLPHPPVSAEEDEALPMLLVVLDDLKDTLANFRAGRGETEVGRHVRGLVWAVSMAQGCLWGETVNYELNQAQEKLEAWQDAQARKPGKRVQS